MNSEWQGPTTHLHRRLTYLLSILAVGLICVVPALAGAEKIETAHIAEAIQHRPRQA